MVGPEPGPPALQALAPPPEEYRYAPKCCTGLGKRSPACRRKRKLPDTDKVRELSLHLNNKNFPLNWIPKNFLPTFKE